MAMFGNRIIGPAVSDCRFDANDVEGLRNNSLTPQLAKIEWRCLTAGQQNTNSATPNDGTRPHVDVLAAH